MVADEPQPACPATNADGTPCKVPPEMLLDSGFCYGHDPDLEEQRKAVRSRGGLTTRLKARRGLDPGELGALDTPEDALRWSRVLAEACATGRLSAGQATAAGRLLQSWLSSRELHVKETSLRELAADVRRLEGRTE